MVNASGLPADRYNNGDAGFAEKLTGNHRTSVSGSPMIVRIG